MNRKWIAPGLVGLCLLLYLAWTSLSSSKLPAGIAAANGRIEAIEIDIASKTAGRLAEVLVNEGDFVTAGQTLAIMDTNVLQAEIREAEAELRRAQTMVESARSNVAQRESSKTAAEAVVEEQLAKRDLAEKRFDRAEKLLASKATSAEEFDTQRAALAGAKASVSRAKAEVAAATAAISSAQSEVIAAEAAVVAAQAKIERLKVDLDDCALKSPRDGRVQYRVAQPGEVLNAGGRVLNLVDVGDVYMTFFLPTAEAGRVNMGADVHLIMDAAPQYVIPAKVTFVADVAQFTPKTVETTEEREKLMFRIKAQISPELLQKYIRSVKTGLPGMAYVRLDERQNWPESLQIKLPQ
ncbi:HlyD family secretion protein [Planctomicrobium sp. SH527]|uniref:HlyD family secretion protein n=1 Tax=Planctomicrobium sp. SH527 TaxID=3448123 RepID=UPI003F5B955C